MEMYVKVNDLDILMIFFPAWLIQDAKILLREWFWGSQRQMQKRASEKIHHFCGNSHQNRGDHHVCFHVIKFQGK